MLEDLRKIYMKYYSKAQAEEISYKEAYYKIQEDLEKLIKDMEEKEATKPSMTPEEYGRMSPEEFEKELGVNKDLFEVKI